MTTPRCHSDRPSADASAGGFTSFGEPDDGLLSLLPAKADTIEGVTSAALDGSGRIVICACGNGTGIGEATIVVRLNLDGSYDTSFGPNSQGYVVDNAVHWAKLALQADGKIVLAGWDLTFTRLLPDGSADPSFNSGNVLTCFTGVPVDEITDVVIDAFGSILVTGMAYTDVNTGSTGFFIGRISPDGVAGTYEVTPFPFQVPPDPTEYSYAESSCTEIRPDGKILMAGYDFDDDGNVLGLGLACYNAYDGLSQRLWVEHDANWNVTSIADVTGTVVQRFQEDPYGGNPQFLTADYQQSTTDYSWLYIHQTGRYDPVAGVIHFRNRDLDPNTGTWRTFDPNPAGPYVDGMSGYAVLRANPLGGTDACGLWDDRVHLKLTARWSIEQGFPQNAAKFIAESDQATDGGKWGSGLGPAPLIGTQSYHFDEDWGLMGVDTRLVHFKQDFAQAVYLASCTIDDPIGAAEALGHALHAQQDWVAHGDYGYYTHGTSGLYVKHNSRSPKRFNLFGADPSLYPDEPSLDAMSGPDGRPAGPAIIHDERYDGEEYAIYVRGNRRINLTREKTYAALREFREELRSGTTPAGPKSWSFFRIDLEP